MDDEARAALQAAIAAHFGASRIIKNAYSVEKATFLAGMAHERARVVKMLRAATGHGAYAYHAAADLIEQDKSR